MQCTMMVPQWLMVSSKWHHSSFREQRNVFILRLPSAVVRLGSSVDHPFSFKPRNDFCSSLSPKLCMPVLIISFYHQVREVMDATRNISAGLRFLFGSGFRWRAWADESRLLSFVSIFIVVPTSWRTHVGLAVQASVRKWNSKVSYTVVFQHRTLEFDQEAWFRYLFFNPQSLGWSHVQCLGMKLSYTISANPFQRAWERCRAIMPRLQFHLTAFLIRS